MAKRRWVDLSRYDGAQLLIAAECPPDGRNRLVVHGYGRSNLSAFGFEQIAPRTWLADASSFKLADLRTWFPGFDPARDIRDMETDAFLIGHEDLGILDDDALIGDLIDRHVDESGGRAINVPTEALAQPGNEQAQSENPDESPPAHVSAGANKRRRATKSVERQRKRIEDAGEKIGGARKDFYARALSRADLASMNDREKIDACTKDNIWPSKSIEQYREEGVHPRVALFVMALRRECPASIKDPDEADSYVALVTALRDISATLREPEDVTGRVNERGWRESHNSLFMQGLREHGIVEIETIDDGSRGNWWKSKSAGDQYSSLLNRDSRAMRFMFDFLYDPEDGYRRAFKAHASKSTPIHREDMDSPEWIRVSELDPDGLYDYLLTCKAASIASRQRTREALAKANEGKSETDYLSRPHLDHLRRTGLPDERDGRDISPEDFLESFGFRACEFGNWLPDIERQDVLNRAYDSLSTLARVLGVDKKFLSLGGTLAVAFGARGVGRAAAHYEPARKVINLTRMSGAGSLAHEFFHAIDDHFGSHVKGLIEAAKYDGRTSDSYYSTELFLTQKRRGRRHDNREIAQQGYVPRDLADRLEPLVEAVNAMTIRNRTDDELRIFSEQSIGRLRSNISGWTRHLLQSAAPELSLDECIRQAAVYEEAVYAEVKEGSALALRAGERHPLIERLDGMFERGAAEKASDERKHQFRESLRRLDANLKALPSEVSKAEDMSKLRASTLGTALINTKYFQAAEALDKKRSPKYWSTVIELAARAFESYVQDTCEARGWRDDYLVHGTEVARFEKAEHPPYPVGHERERINQAFEHLVSSLRDELSPAVEVAPVSAPRPKAA